MKRLFVFLMLIALPLSSQGYNEHILKIETNIIPRIIFMDYKFEEKLVNGAIDIAIVHNNTDLITAQKIEKLFMDKYPQGLKSHPLSVRLIPYGVLKKEQTRATFYYLMDSDANNIRQAVNTADLYRALTFVHDAKNLRYGAHISLRIDKKIIPYINPASLKESKISLRPALFAISELFQ